MSEQVLDATVESEAGTARASRLPGIAWAALVLIAVNLLLAGYLRLSAKSDSVRLTEQLATTGFDGSSAEKPSPFDTPAGLAIAQRQARITKPRPMVPLLQPAIDFAVSTVQALRTEAEADPVPAQLAGLPRASNVGH